MAFWSRRSIDDDEAYRLLDLGQTLVGQRDWGSAVVVFRKAAKSRDPHIVQSASLMLGILYTQLGQDRLADRAWKRTKGGDPAIAVLASGLALQAAIDPHSVRFPDLRGNRRPSVSDDQSGGGLHAAGASVAEARAQVQNTPASKEAAELAYRRAVASGHPEHAPFAAQLLGHLLFRRGDAAGAIAAFQQGVDTGDPDFAPSAAFALGSVQAAVGDVRGARASCDYVLKHGKPDDVELARELLEQLKNRP